MAAEMVRSRQDLEFWIVGDDTEGSGRRMVLEQLAGELDITSYIRFLGHRSDIPDIIRQLHLLVVPSQFEPFGRVVIEAMACGRPVIGSRDGGIPEIIDDGKTGSLVEVGDYVGFSRAAIDLINNKELRENMSKNSVEAVQRSFSIQAHTKIILDIYGELLAK
jgi:glycosyltransferase involved in cell wall biosynthesis